MTQKIIAGEVMPSQISTLYTISILSRSKGNTIKFIDAVKQQIESSGQVFIPGANISMARKYWKLLKNKGCECSFNHVYDKSFICQPDPKISGFIFFKPTYP